MIKKLAIKKDSTAKNKLILKLESKMLLKHLNRRKK